MKNKNCINVYGVAERRRTREKHKGDRENHYFLKNFMIWIRMASIRNISMRVMIHLLDCGASAGGEGAGGDG
jgi:hypothetical protein